MPRILILCMLLIGGKSVLALTTTAPLVQQEDISLVQNSPKPNVTCFCWCAGIPPIIRAIIPVCSTCPHSATGVPFPPTTNCTNTTNTTAEIISKSNESPDAVIRDQRTLIAGITPSPFPNITCLCWCAKLPPILRTAPIIPVCSSCPGTATGVPFPRSINCTRTTILGGDIQSAAVIDKLGDMHLDDLIATAIPTSQSHISPS